MSEILLTISLNSSSPDAKKSFMLSVPIKTLLTLLALILLSFEIQSYSWAWSELIFITSVIKLADSVSYFRWIFSLSDCSILFRCNSSLIWFTKFTLRSTEYRWKKLFKFSKMFLGNRDVLSFVRSKPSLHKRFLSVFSLHMKANRKFYINF